MNHQAAGVVADSYPQVPAELKALPHWMVWNYVTRTNGKGESVRTKVPFDPKSNKAGKATDPKTWASYDTALHASGTYEGLGFALAPPFVVIDIDKVRNPETGQTEDWAEDIVSELNSYTELSPSGTGFHIWVKGKLPSGGNRKGRVEMYCEKRYMTVTGQHVDGTPLTIEERDLTGVHAGMVRGELDPRTKSEREARPKPSPSSRDTFEALMAGHWRGQYTSQSEADLALCCMLVRKFGPDPEKIDMEFRKSGLCRKKWERADYRKHTIEKAIQGCKERPPVPQSSKLVVMDAPRIEEMVDIIPKLPAECLEGDYLGELARLLTDGTSMPPDFAYSTIKAVVGAILNGRVAFPNHNDLHLRHYNINVSTQPRTGKGEAWKRVAAPGTGWLHSLLEEADIEEINGGLFGSGQFLVAVLEDHKKAFARFDEMKAMFERNDGPRSKSNSVENKLLELYEKTEVAQGSFTYRRHEADCEFSFSGDFTLEGFESTFSGRGSQGSGFLSRCVLSLADKTVHFGDWRDIPETATTRLVAKIREKIEGLPQLDGNRFVPGESEDALQKRYEFLKWLNQQDTKFTPELMSHLKRDLLMRALFSDGRITSKNVMRSIAWTKHQLELRQRLWPEDSGSLDERMERQILANLKKHGQLTQRQLAQMCHVNRPGSGGYYIFTRAIRSLLMSHTIVQVGMTRKGQPIFELYDEE